MLAIQPINTPYLSNMSRCHCNLFTYFFHFTFKIYSLRHNLLFKLKNKDKNKKPSDSTLVNYIWCSGYKPDIFGLDNINILYGMNCNTVHYVFCLFVSYFRILIHSIILQWAVQLICLISKYKPT